MWGTLTMSLLSQAAAPVASGQQLEDTTGCGVDRSILVPDKGSPWHLLQFSFCCWALVQKKPPTLSRPG